jgi:hypothetical protein
MNMNGLLTALVVVAALALVGLALSVRIVTMPHLTLPA